MASILDLIVLLLLINFGNVTLLKKRIMKNIFLKSDGENDYNVQFLFIFIFFINIFICESAQPNSQQNVTRGRGLLVYSWSPPPHFQKRC